MTWNEILEMIDYRVTMWIQEVIIAQQGDPK